MKLLLLSVVTVLLISSCDTRLDPIKAVNENPVITFSNEANAWGNNKYLNALIDSCKIHRTYYLTYELTEEQNYTPFTVKDYEGFVWMTFEDTLHTDLKLGLKKGINTIEVHPEQTGTRVLEFNLIDGYGAVSSPTTLTLTCFDNLDPRSDISVNATNVNQNEILIDATGCYDRDAQYGGGIIRYQYIIDTDTTTYPQATFTTILPTQGTYVIGVRAMDNDSVWSPVSETNFTI